MSRSSWLVICDRCGQKYKSPQLRLEWTGLRVCSPCFEVRHPQDFVRGKPDIQNVPWVRPRPEDVFRFRYLRWEDGTVIHQENGIPYLLEDGS